MFKDINGYEWLYSIDEFWNIISFQKWGERLLKHWKDKDWYLMVILCNKWKNKTLRVHRLVAIAFIPNPNNYPVVMHLDNDPSNNRVENLKWGTYKDNMDQMNNEWRSIHLKWIDCFHYWKFWKNHIRARKVNQYTLEWELIKTWGSIMDIDRELWFNYSSISQCCSWRYKKSRGFLWKYA